MAIDTQNVTLSVEDNANPGTFADVFCVLELGEYTQERAKNEYSCMSSNDSTVSLGSITRSPLDLQLLYNEDTADGQELLKQYFNNNETFNARIEFDNAPSGGTQGTTLEGTFGLSAFVMSFPKDGKIGASFTMEFISAPTLTPAA